MGKNLKGENVERVSAKEKTVSTPQDIPQRTVPARKSILIRSRKLATGLPMHSTRISTMFTILPPK